MKNQIKTILFASFVCLSLFVGLPARAQFSAGLRAGTNLSTLNGDGRYHVFLARLYGGVMADYMFSTHLSLELELNLVGRGENTSPASSIATDTKLRETSFTIPLLIQYHLFHRLYIEAGPQLGFLLSAKETYAGITTSVKDGIKSTDIGAGVGIGYEFGSQPGKGLGISIRFMRGLTGIDNTAGATKVTNRELNFGLTYRIAKRGKPYKS